MRKIKFRECAIYSTALDITDVVNQLAAEGHPVDTDDLVTITPYISHTIRRMGDLVLNLSPPEEAPTTRLDLEPRVCCSPPGAPPDRVSMDLDVRVECRLEFAAAVSAGRGWRILTVHADDRLLAGRGTESAR